MRNDLREDIKKLKSFHPGSNAITKDAINFLEHKKTQEIINKGTNHDSSTCKVNLTKIFKAGASPFVTQKLPAVVKNVNKANNLSNASNLELAAEGVSSFVKHPVAKGAIKAATQVMIDPCLNAKAENVLSKDSELESMVNEMHNSQANESLQMTGNSEFESDTFE